jgi:1-acyl-sn-glycerol-3-phosphate acyltransferase
MIRTIFVAVAITLFTLVAGPPLILYARVSGSVEALYHIGVRGVFLILRAAGMRTRVEGLENIPNRACIFAANHTSNTDGPAILHAIPRRLGILAKKSLFSAPIVGMAFRMARFVPVDREHPGQAKESIDVATEYAKQGLSFLIYPEGTRSPDGRLLRFKGGAFALAIKAGVPVVPVACAGAHRILPRKSLRMRPGEVVVRFCPPIDAAAYTVERRAELAERVHAAIAAALPPDQRPLVRISPQPAL